MLFTGRLTGNAEVSTVKGDRKVTNFTVALNQRFKTKSGEKREKTAFVECAYWVNPALADFLTRGAVVEISGWVEADVWTDRKGETHPRLTCNVDQVKLFSASFKAITEQEASQKSTANAATGADNDDLPF